MEASEPEKEKRRVSTVVVYIFLPCFSDVLAPSTGCVIASGTKIFEVQYLRWAKSRDPNRESLAI